MTYCLMGTIVVTIAFSVMRVLRIEVPSLVSATEGLCWKSSATGRTMDIIDAKPKRTPTRTLKPKGGMQ